MNATPQKTAVKVVLEYLTGPAQPLEPRRVIAPTPAGYTLGRSMGASWPLPEDSLLSRSHFRLDATEHGCTLTDLGSTNGTAVDGSGTSGDDDDDTGAAAQDANEEAPLPGA